MSKYIKTQWKIKDTEPLELLKNRGFNKVGDGYRKYGYRELGEFFVNEKTRKIIRNYKYDDALRENPTIKELEEIGILDIAERVV